VPSLSAPSAGPRARAGRRLAGALTAVLLSVLAWAAGAAAAEPVRLAPETAQNAAPDLAVNADGRAVVAWTARSGRGFAVMVATRPSPRGAWTAAAPLAPASAVRPLEPRAAIGRAGDAVVVWREAGGPVRSAVRHGPVGHWRAADVSAGGTGWSDPAVAIGAGGAATAVWGEGAGDDWTVRRATLGGPDAAWRVDPPLASAGPPLLAVGSGGVAAAILGPAPVVPVSLARARPLRVAVAAGAAGWGPPATVAPAAVQPAVAVGPAGDVLAAWTASDGGAPVVRAAWRAAGAAAFAPAEALAPGGQFPRVAVNGEGYAVMGWAEGVSKLSVRARIRSGASGLWGPSELVYDDFAYHSIIELAHARAAIDEHREAYLAWLDPEGPGSATVHAAHRRNGAWDLSAALPVREDVDDLALGVGARGDAVLASPRAGDLGGPDLELAVLAVPDRRPITLTVEALLIEQRISQAAVRRANAAAARLAAGLGPLDIRDGTLGVGAFGPGVTLEGAPSGAPVSPGPGHPLEVAAATPSGRPVRLTAGQLLINQRVSQAAVRRSAAARAELEAGLTGHRVLDGSLTPAKLLPGLRVASAVDAPLTQAPVGLPTPPRPAAPGRVAVTQAQLVVNQRIAQAAVLRANWLVEKLEAGITEADLRPGALLARHLAARP
jgi:hypothetical protein